MSNADFDQNPDRKYLAKKASNPKGKALFPKGSAPKVAFKSHPALKGMRTIKPNQPK
jgi:hypothetical protein